MENDNRACQVLRSMDGRVLYQGYHPTYAAALESAFQQSCDLTGLDARRKRLISANLDGLHIRSACFNGSDFSHANITESTFESCQFDDARFIDSCLCYTDFRGCRMIESIFGHTDISQASFDNCRISGTSALSLRFSTAHKIRGNLYIHKGEAVCMTKTPIVLEGFRHRITVFDDRILVGQTLYPFDRNRLSNLSAGIPARVES